MSDMMPFINLDAQYRSLKSQIDRAVQSVLNEGRYIMGPEVEAFERELAEVVQVKHCISCANGTDAMVMALMALEIGPGDAVFVPSFTFMSTAEVASLVGATPIFCDIHLRTFNLDPEDLEAKIQAVREEGKLVPKAIIAVDLFGLCADYPHLERIAKEQDCYLIEDGAQGFGGSIRQQQALSFGHVATTSFFPAKPLGCYGDGGAMLTDDDDLAELLRSLRVHGKGEHKYDNVRIGMNSRLDTIQAAILRVKLDAFERYEMSKRQELASFYDAHLRAAYETPFVPAGYVSSWAQYSLLLPDRSTRDEVQRKLKEAGIPSMVYYQKPLHLQAVYRPIDDEPQALAQSVAASERILQIPMHPYMPMKDARYIVETLLALKA